MPDSAGLLQIDLPAIGRNWRQVRQRVSDETLVAAVVKANGYGLGAQEVTRALGRVGCRHFFVATMDEARTLSPLLKEEGLEERTLYVLSGARSQAELAECREQGVVPVLYTPAQIDTWARLNREMARPCVIKVDTGMHRLGLAQEEFATLLQSPALIRACRPSLLMSHLACADEPDHPLNAQQLRCFQDNAARFQEIVPDVKLSLANSFGVFSDGRYHFDMVRPGICLYGGNPQPYAANPMAPVVQLELPVAQVKQITGPATLGYGATYSVPEGETLTIGIALGGYGDGILRHLSNRGKAMAQGCEVPIVGRVSMDSVIFDFTSLRAQGQDPDAVRRVTLIGDGNFVDQLAADAGTISYEVLTRLGSRYRRCYLREGDAV